VAGLLSGPVSGVLSGPVAGQPSGPVVVASSVPGVSVDRPVHDRRLTELSGLAVSPGHPGVLWTHNDSGNAPVVYALGPDGAVVAAVRVGAVAAEDWEAIATFRDADGRAMIAVGDIGDNLARRPAVQVVLIEEPPLRDATVTPRRVLRLRYPDGAVDAETLLVDPEAGRMYLVTKGLGGTVYQVPTDVWPGDGHPAPRDSGTLVRIASVPLVLVTDGVLGPGHHPVLRTYGELAVLPPVTDDVAGGTLEPLAVAALPPQRQGEGVTLDRTGDVLLSSEGMGQPILRLRMPADLAATLNRAAAARSAAATGAPAAPGTRPGAVPPGAASRAPSPRATPSGAAGVGGGVLARVTGWPVLGAIAALAALAAALVGRALRRRAPRQR
jgi:hypothetical protein